MKVLQTLGRHGATAQEGVFQYRRGVQGVFIDGAIGLATSLNPSQILITPQEWQEILQRIQNTQFGTFRLSGSNVAITGPNHILYEEISAAVPHPTHGWNWTDSWRAYVAAILEHEGSVDIYAGVLGRDQPGAYIALAKDTQ